MTAPAAPGLCPLHDSAKVSDATGTAIGAQATVVFDTNAPLNTNTAANTIDSGRSTSSVSALPSYETGPFTVSWSGTDDAGGSGLAFYDVYVSINGAVPTVWQQQTTALSAQYTGTVGDTYAFYSVATDNVGLREPTPTQAQASTTVVAPLTAAITAVSPNPSNSAVSSLTITFNAAVTNFDLADLQLQRNGTTVALTSATLTSSDNITWTLGNLAGLTDPTHHWDNYTLTLTAAGSGITGPAGQPLSAIATTAFTVLDPALFARKHLDRAGHRRQRHLHVHRRNA